jgi:uncharacterized protein YaeQ
MGFPSPAAGFCGISCGLVRVKFSFQLSSGDPRRALPRKIVIARHPGESGDAVLLKVLGYLLFFRERLQIEPSLHTEGIPYTPGLIQLDYELRPVLWVECGACPVQRLDRLAVKVPDAEIWTLTTSAGEAQQLLQAMTRAELRRQRYHVIGLDAGMFAELRGLLQSRNEVFWVGADFEEGTLQFEFNGLWFDAGFERTRF